MKKPQERRYAPTSFEVREAGDGTIGFSGYAAVFDQVAYGEVIRAGAFTKTLAEGPDVRMLVNHGGVPIARTKSGTLKLSQDDRGLFAEVDSLDPANPTVAELVSAMKRGDMDQMSFAFWPVLESKSDDGVRELLEVGIDDGDVSVVTVPWYDETSAEINSLEHAFAELRAGRPLTSELRSVVIDSVEGRQTKKDKLHREHGDRLCRDHATAAAEGRALDGWTFSDLYDLLDEALDDMIEPAWGYVWDVSSEWFAYYTGGQFYQCSYTVDDAGAVVLGDPQAVILKTTYLDVPADDDSAEDAQEAGSSLSEMIARGWMTAEEIRRIESAA